jgi:hypothetical protein
MKIRTYSYMIFFDGKKPVNIGHFFYSQGYNKELNYYSRYGELFRYLPKDKYNANEK